VRSCGGGSGIPELNFPSIKGNAISSAADSLTHTPNSQNGGGIGLPSIKDASRDTVALVVGQVVDQLGHLPLAQGELCFALVVITIRRSKTDQGGAGRQVGIPCRQPDAHSNSQNGGGIGTP